MTLFLKTKKHKITSHQKAHNGQMDHQQQDLIINLPYGLLLHILSFLDTKNAVQTCVLAKAWNCLWLSVHSLRLDSTLFTRHSFDPFVNSLLSHRNHHTSDLHHLHFSRTFAYVLDLTPHDSPIFSNLLEHSLSRNCRSFSLGHIHFLCPDIVSVLPSVTSLRLHNCKFLGPKQSNSYDHYDDDNFSVDLRRRTRTWAKVVSHLNVFSNCPNLRDLSLINCRMSSSEVFEISCPKLARLTVHYPYLYDSDFNKKCEVVVSAPELTFLDIVDVSPFPMMIMAPESLSGVSFNVNTCYGKDQELKGMISMLQELRGARVLELSMLVVQVLDKVPQLLENQPLRFHNLKHLKLIINRSCRGFCVPDYVMNYLVAYSPSTKVTFAS